jgi:uncharacterized protein YndB with AHSA1/START domain
MAKIEGSTVIARSVEDVFDFVADERNEPKYNARMVRVDKMTPGPIANGTCWSATVESRGRPVDMDIEVIEYARPSRLASITRMSTAEIHGALTFQPDPGGTRMRWSWQVQPKGVFRLMGPVIARLGRQQEAEIWTGLKRYLESTALPTTGSNA